MRLQRFNTQFIALSLAILTFVATAPLSAAEVSAPANIGSVSAVGSVQLRGVGISEGTLFSGDRLNVAPDGYAKVVLGAGPKIEIGGSSDVTVSRDADAVNIQMTSGNVAFTGNGQKPVRVRVGVYEVTASGQSKGSVTFVGSSAFDVRAMEGSITIRNTATKQSYTVQKGTERLVSLSSNSNAVGVQLASSAPSSIPAPPSMPAPAAGKASMKTALIVGSVLGSAAAIAILMTKNDDTDSEAAKRLANAQLSSNVSAIETTSSAIVANNAAITASANAAVAAIAASTTLSAADKTNLTNQANALLASAATSNAALAALGVQISTAKAQLASGSFTSSLLLALLAQEEAERANSNKIAASLFNLLNSNSVFVNVSKTNFGTVGAPNIASPSNP